MLCPFGFQAQGGDERSVWDDSDVNINIPDIHDWRFQTSRETPMHDLSGLWVEQWWSWITPWTKPRLNIHVVRADKAMNDSSD